MKSLSHVRLLVTHGLQPTRLLHPWDFPGKSTRVGCHCLLRPTPRAFVNSCPSSQWCIQLSHPLSFPSPPAFNLSQHQGLFQWVSSSHQVAKVLELQHQSFQWIFRNDFVIDWLDFLVVQRTLKNLHQHHSSKASILWHPAFFMVQLLHPYMTTGKTIALTRWTFVCKEMSLL